MNKIKLTLTPEAAAVVKQMYENGEFADIGIEGLTEVDPGRRHTPSTAMPKRGSIEQPPAAIEQPPSPPDTELPQKMDVTVGRGVIEGVEKATGLDGIAKCYLTVGEFNLTAYIRVVRDGV